MRLRLMAVLLLSLAPALLSAARDPDGYRSASSPYRFHFPRDHAAHPDFRTEWWYYTGQLAGPGVRFGYQLTFFRVGIDTAWRSSPSRWAPHDVVFAHLALTDVNGRRFRFAERIARPALDLAGADTTRYRVWVYDWEARLAGDGRTHHLAAAEPGGAFAIALDLVPEKRAVVHGRGGVSRKSARPGHASHYYSLTRMRTSGSVRVGGRSLAVTGSSWMDHEFGSDQLAPDQVGWDWFGIQLDDGTDLMLYRMRSEGSVTEPWTSGTWVSRDGSARALRMESHLVEATGSWKSPHSGGTYPSGWVLRFPAERIELAVTPRVRDQELQVQTAGGAAYWEGAVSVTGRVAGRVLNGRGYVELTGYAGKRLRF
jgi:predicted secreted hydrolase